MALLAASSQPEQPEASHLSLPVGPVFLFSVGDCVPEWLIGGDLGARRAHTGDQA